MSEKQFESDVNTEQNEIGVGVSPDHPAEIDEIGFESYTDALRLLLSHPTTSPPLTISVEGPWGSGKTSFMNQLADKLEKDGHRTIEFNPWRHESEDALWAAFVLEFLRQLRSDDDFNRRQRLCARLSLLRMRLRVSQSYVNILLSVSKGVALSLLTLGGLTVFWSALPNILNSTSPGSSGIHKILLGTGGLFVGLSAFLTIIKRLKSQLFNPLQVDIGKYINNPDYEGRQAFITKFHRDFDQIVKSYTNEDERVFVFIDDLDRCEVPKAADLMQSINLLTESRPRIIFVIGIDRQKVASGVAAKHEDILPYLSGSAVAVEERQSDAGASGIEFGYEYLEKFIQLPFQVPEAKESDMRSLLTPAEGTQERTPSARGGNNEDIDTWVERELFEGQSDLLDQVSEMVVPALNNNPRRVKKFGNVYRLQAILASQESILQSNPSSEFDPRMSLEQLAKFVVIRIQWRRFASIIASRPDILTELEEYAVGKRERGNLSSLSKEWAHDKELIELLRFGVDSKANDNLYCSFDIESSIPSETVQSPKSYRIQEAYSLQEVDLNNLIRVSPIIEEPKKENISEKQEDDLEQYSEMAQEMISGEFSLFPNKPDKEDIYLRIIGTFLNNPEGYWKAHKLADETGDSTATVKEILTELRRYSVLDEDSIGGEPVYNLNPSNRIVNVLTNISNNIPSKSFNRRMSILLPMVSSPNTVFPVQLFCQELGYSENSVHHHLTQLHERGIVTKGDLPGSVGASYRYGYKVNTNNEVSKILIDMF